MASSAGPDPTTERPAIRVLVSSCLLGERVRYDGSDAACDNTTLQRWLSEGRVVPFCPEVAGGFPVPRPAAEIVPGDGRQVLDGAAIVSDHSGNDVTPYFLAGARKTLDWARLEGVRLAVLKDGSPSCGSSYVYDGTFRGMRAPGQGVTTALLERNGIRVFSERQFEQAEAYLADLEKSSTRE
jgi:uncharacterized protein YbbK (DUF523 family)